LLTAPRTTDTHPLSLHDALPIYAQLAAEIEQLVLDVDEDVTHLIRQGLGQHQADAGIELIDRAIGLDAGIVLGDTRAVAKPRAAVIAGAGVDLAQPMRSEEHTSELQSRENLVCRLL